MRATFLLVLALLFCPLLSPAAPFASRNAAVRAGSHPDDATIEQSLRTKLAKSKIGKDGFQVHVKGGVVTWEGHTSVAQHKGAATRMAHASGATRVVNNIHVDGGNGQKARKVAVQTE
ncbi:MAG TPA: BON domain-containing protein [Bryobacteraceae bacterium]|jgi:hypothetical protein|nr:BON domain-containing protein [Bryobacteraceae bacterium]